MIQWPVNRTIVKNEFLTFETALANMERVFKLKKWKFALQTDIMLFQMSKSGG